MGNGWLRLVITFLWTMALAVQTDPETDRDHNMMKILTEANFDKIIGQYQLVLVQFFVPWCGHCKKFSHELTKASDLSRATNQSIVFGILNAEQHESLARRFNVYNYPSLRLFLNQTMIHYDGPRDHEAILAWVAAKATSNAVPISNTQEIHDYLDRYPAVLSVIGPDIRELEVLNKFAKTNSDTGVVYIPTTHQTSDSTQKRVKAVLHRRYAKEKGFEPWLLQEETLLEFVHKYKHKPVCDFDSLQSVERVFNEPGSSLVFFTNDSSDSFLPRFHKIAEDNQHQLKSFLVQNKHQFAKELREFLGLGADRPRRAVFMLVTTPSQATNSYRLVERINGWNIHMFIKRWQNGRLDNLFANLTDEQLILDLNLPSVHQRLQVTNSTCCVFNFRGEECEKRPACRIKLRKFDKFASRLFLVKRLEFCYLNFDRSYQFTKGEYYDYMRAPMPALSLTLRGTEQKAVFADFDWKFDSLLLWLKSELPEDLSAALIKAF